ncbi:helix-turn-helix transcriptional regulator [Fangia hongkongensis]|uniref:helix-turn-helix transcriptional regulator n=1 Tax=Fangia hongkongensis TaxID=270495 RepID=UPI00036F962F|nr:LuxR C-terminal-related transcriptional regulator [Fangia hongkongensis]MBK2125910.1 hypothetical protein [Fangia hongkongensis]
MNQNSFILPENMLSFFKHSKHCHNVLHQKYHNYIDKFGFNKFWRLYVQEDGMFSMISSASKETYRQYAQHNMHQLSEIIKHPSYIHPGIYLDSTIYVKKPESLKIIREIGKFEFMVYCIIKLNDHSYITYVFNSPTEIVISEQFGQKIMRLARQIEAENSILLEPEPSALLDLKIFGMAKWLAPVEIDNIFYFDVSHISRFLLKIGLVQNGLETLTKKELMCLALLGQDCDINQIAIHMKIPKRTAYYYCDSIKSKLGLYSLQALYKIANLSIPFLHDILSYSGLDATKK